MNGACPNVLVNAFPSGLFSHWSMQVKIVNADAAAFPRHVRLQEESGSASKARQDAQEAKDSMFASQ
jgi:hypothetical protein